MGTNYLTDGPVTTRIISHYIDKIGGMTNSGGHSIFLGQVRADQIDGKKVVAIEYSAYEELVKIEADKIKETVLSEFNDANTIDIVHSIGIVKAGEVSLIVLVTAGHRHHAISACSKTLELIKEKLPVWKKEIFDDQSHEWKQNTPH
ncbi:MAG: molybdenum cofactor biosynthesis protein MoaE [Bacteroidales bacterium]|nr:molybdenum cofactor biosynthesis protein MoaE [Bacteroidales bacterium]